MDPFGYSAASAAAANGYNMPEDGPVGNGWSPRRDELAELVRRLRTRFGRRRLFNRFAVEEVVRDLVGERDFFVRAPPTVLRPTPPTVVSRAPRPVRRITPVQIDLVDADSVME